MRSPLLALTLLIAAAPSALTQESTQPPRFFAGGSFVYGAPQGDFGEQIDEALGARGHLLYRVQPEGWLALRLDAGALTYGQERFRTPLSPTIGGRILVDVTTSNNIFFLGLGPQVAAPRGWMRPYAHGFAGVTILNTTSSVDGTRDWDGGSFASTTNQDDAAFLYGGGMGVYFPVSTGRTPVSLDFGLTYHRSGEARYLREGDIEDLPDGSIIVRPVRTRTDLMSLNIGVSIGIVDRNDREGR